MARAPRPGRPAGAGKRRRPSSVALAASSVPLPARALAAVPSSARMRRTGLPMWLASLAAFCVAAASFVFAMQWRGLIVFAMICFGLWYGYRWLKLYWPEATNNLAYFGRGFLRGFFGRRY
jgi:hypothetical protein